MKQLKSKPEIDTAKNVTLVSLSDIKVCHLTMKGQGQLRLSKMLDIGFSVSMDIAFVESPAF